MLLNMLSSAVKAKPVANIDFILTSDRSRLLFFSFSSSRSIFFLCDLSNESPWVSFRFSTAIDQADYDLHKSSILSSMVSPTYISCFASPPRPSVSDTFPSDRPSTRLILKIESMKLSEISILQLTAEGHTFTEERGAHGYKYDQQRI